MKPRLKKIANAWFCYGDGTIKSGTTPRVAYALWCHHHAFAGDGVNHGA